MEPVPDESPGKEQPPRQREELSFGCGWLLWPLLVLVVYVLSIGPAAVVHSRVKNATVQNAIEVCYSPVVLLIERTPLSKPLSWWVELWLGPRPMK
jgi:hypothetical protein